MARIAENTVIVDGQEYKPGDVIPDFKSIKCVDTREPRKYQGLSADVSVLNDVIAKYASGGASCFMSDTGEYYEYDRKEKTWKLITNITERGFDSEKAYGALKHMLKNVTVSDDKIQSAVTNYLTVNPVLPGATTEQAQQIEQNKADVASLKEETGSLKEDLDNNVARGYRKNLFDKDSVMVGYRLYVNQVGTKQTYTTNDTKCIIRIPIEGGKTFGLTKVSAYSFVDNENTLVTATTIINSLTTHTVSAPPEAKFIWVQAEGEHLNQAQVEYGSPTEYMEYDNFSSIMVGNKKILPIPFISEDNKYIALKGDKYICTDDLPVISEMDLTTVVNPQMAKNEFIDAINSKIAEYAELCKCSTRSFNEIIKGNGYNNDWDFIFKTINHNLRKDIAVGGKSFEMICSDINKAFKERISRFCDAKLETGNSRDFSLNTGFQADEPSAIVSEDGSTLYIYAHLKRISTTDGVNWTEPINTTLTGTTDKNYIMHNNVNLINGTYYMIGATENTGGNLVLYTSTDGINFTYDGILFKSGETFGGSYATESFGNTYLIKEYGSNKFYLYVEYQASGTSWIISVAICDDIFHVNSDGTIGNWIFANSNPIIISPNKDYSRNSSSAGNPDFAKGMDNRPIKVDGKYYMYFHSTINSIAHIMRAKSSDLIDWEIEGIILDNRDVPTGGDSTSGNADACIIEFKGRTYLFYTWDINNSSVKPYIKYMIDDRPLHEFLKLRP